MRMKIFCTVALFACLFIACEKDNDDYEPVKPPIEQPKKPVEPEEPEKPDEPTVPPSTDDIINIKIGDLNMIVGSNNWNAVAYGNGKYVAVGSKGGITYSEDGINWTTAVAGSYTWTNVVYGNGKFVAAGSTGHTAFSENGINWTTRQPGSSSRTITCITYGNGKFVAGYPLDTYSYILISTDGMTFRNMGNSLIPSGQYLESMIYESGKFRAMARYGTIFESTDGEVWEQISVGASFSFSYPGTSIAYYKEKYVMVGGNGQIIAPNNAGEYQKISVGSEDWNRVLCINGRFVAIGEGGYYTVSENGINWSEPARITDESGNAITANLNGICAVH